MRIAACTLSCLFVSALGLRADLLFVDFESAELGDYTETDLLADWAGAGVFQGVDDNPVDGTDDGRVSIVNDPTGGTNKVLEVRFPSGASSSGDSGASWVYNFGTETEVWAQYDVFIPTGTEFVRGGKLPGLAGGGRDTNPGFSNRMMWRSQSAAGNSSGGATAPVGSANLVYYTHHPALASGAQEDFKWTDVVSSGAWLQPTTGEWHTVTQQVVLDSPGSDDGVIRGYWDGALMSEEVLGLTDDTYGIDQFYFSTFYGGSDITWAPGTDQKFYFDNFEISTTALVPVPVPEPSGILCAGIVLTIGMTRFRRRPRSRIA